MLAQTGVTRRAWNTNYLNEKTFVLLDELAGIAKAINTTVARVALSWVQNRPGVTSTIIGARTRRSWMH